MSRINAWSSLDSFVLDTIFFPNHLVKVFFCHFSGIVYLRMLRLDPSQRGAWYLHHDRLFIEPSIVCWILDPVNDLPSCPFLIPAVVIDDWSFF